MSIQDKLKNTQKYLRSTRQAILGRGGEIAENAGLQDVAYAIYDIPADTSLVYRTDDSVAYRKIAPIGVEEYAQVTQIGGMSYKSHNILPFPYSSKSGVYEGVTVTVNSDRSITFNGTATGYFVFSLADRLEPKIGVAVSFGSALPIGTRFSCDFNFIDENDELWCDTWTIVESGNDSGYESINYYQYLDCIFIQIDEGTVLNHLTIRPMIVDGLAPMSYEDYFLGLRDTKTTKLVSEHGNLFNFDNIYNGAKGNNNTINIQTTGYHFNIYTGLTGSGAYVPINDIPKLMYLSKGTYYLYFDIEFEVEVADEYKWMQARQVFPDGSHQWCGSEGQKIFNGGFFTMLEDGYCMLTRYFNKRCTISNLMVTKTPRTEYISYNPSIMSIHEAIQNINGYGRGVEGYPNYIDFVRKVFVQNTYRIVFDGTEKWGAAVAVPQGEKDTGIKRMYFDTPPYTSKNIAVNEISPMICNLYTTDTPENTWYCVNKTCACRNKTFHFYDDEYATIDSVEAWKAHLAELYAQGNPLTVEYALAEPIETDISAYLKDGNFLAVEGRGVITADNTYKYDVPTTINYLTKMEG